MKKRVLSLLLCLIMALSLIPTAAFATEVADVENEVVTYGKDGKHGKPDGDKDPNPAPSGTHIDVDFNGTVTIGKQKVNVKIVNLSAVVDGNTYNDFTEQRDNQWRRSFSGSNRPTYDSTVTIRCTLKESNGSRTWDFEKTYTRNELVYAKDTYCPDHTGFDFNITKDVQEQITKGTLTIKKVLAAGAPAAANDIEFEFKIMQGDKQVGDTIKVKAGETSTPVQLPEGDYTVEEVNGTIDGYQLSTTVSYGTPTSEASTQCNPPKKHVVEAGKNTEVTVTNTYTENPPATGSLIVEKHVTAAMGTRLPGKYDFTLTDANGNEFPFKHADGTTSADFSLTVGTVDESRTVKIENLPIGTYTVTEKDASIKGHTLKVTYQNGNNEPLTPNRDGSISVEIKANETATVHVINEYTQDTQNISVTKVWNDDDNAYGIRPESVTVQLWTTGENAEKVQELTLTADKNWKGTFDPVPTTTRLCEEITYEVKEVPVPGYKGEVSGNAKEGFTVTNTPKESITAEVPATLTIKKVDKDGNPLQGAVFTLSMLEKGGRVSKTIDATTGKDGICTFKDLKQFDGYPKYTLEETTAPIGYQKLNTTWTVSFAGNTRYEPVQDSSGTITGYKSTLIWEVSRLTPDDNTPAPEKVNGAYVIENEKWTDVTVTNLKVTKEVTLAREGITPGTAKFVFKASYLDPMSVEDKLVEFKNNTLTITTTGKETKTEDWKLVVPAEAFDGDGDAFIVVEEVNGGLTTWKYSKVKYYLYVGRNGEAFLIDSNNPTPEIAPIVDPLTFKNVYDYTYTPRPTPNPKPTPKPTTVKSVKTGDMGIAMYAMTSLLSLGGAALVIKKRKDEE